MQAILTGVVPADAIACRQAPTGGFSGPGCFRAACPPCQSPAGRLLQGGSSGSGWFRAPCPPYQSPAGRLLQGVLGFGVVPGDVPAVSIACRQAPTGGRRVRGGSGRRARRIDRLQAGSYRGVPRARDDSGRRARRVNRLQAGSYRGVLGSGMLPGGVPAVSIACRQAPTRGFLGFGVVPGAVPAVSIACRQAPTGGSRVRGGSGRRARRVNRLQAGSYSAGDLERSRCRRLPAGDLLRVNPARWP